MKIVVEVHHHDRDLLMKLESIETKVDDMTRKVAKMAGALNHLIDEVTEIKGKAQSLIALVNGLAQLIRDNVGNESKLNELADSLDAQSGAVQAAIDANAPLLGGGGGGAVVALPDGVVGVAYEAQLTPPVGIAPFSFSVESGALPGGVVADTSAPVIRGTPDAAGDFAFALRVQDADAGTTDEVRNYTIKVNPAA